MTEDGTSQDPGASTTKTIFPMVVEVLAVVVIVAGLVIAFTVRLQWTFGRIYVRLLVVTLAVNLVCLLRWNPELLRQRMLPGRGTKVWDIVWGVVNAPLWIAVYVVAALDARDGPSSTPGAAWLLGLALFVPAWALVIWSMVVNPFFEKTVRIQTDRGHRVVDAGPYAYVRHPGYLGFALWLLSTPLLLGSAWAFVPAVLAVFGFAIRTALEDRTLHGELPGYADYADRTPSRLIPGVW